MKARVKATGEIVEVHTHDDEDKILREENVKKWIPIGSFYSSDAKCKNRI